MPKLPITSESRVTYDEQSRALRTWFDTTVPAMGKAGFVPHDLARQVLSDNAELFRWSKDLPDLRDHRDINAQNAYSIRFTQEFKDIPVDSSEVIVNLYDDGRVYSIYNNYHYHIPTDLDPKKIEVTASKASQLVKQLLRAYEKYKVSKPVLIVYQYQRDENHPPKPAGGPTLYRDKFLATVGTHLAEVWRDNQPREGQYYLAWDMTVTTENPTHLWRVLVDAMTGQLINVIDLLQYATGNAQVFDPNPIVTSGNTSLRHNSAAATLNGERVSMTVDRLNAADASGNLHLDGSYIHMQEAESPTIAEPTSSTGNFAFSFDDNHFLDAMTYFHIDRFQDYVQSILGLTNSANYSIPADPEGLSGVDNSHYVPGGSGTGRIAFGGGIVPVPSTNPVPDAADAMVILHEYGHAIQDNVNPGFNNPVSGVGEGFGDFLAAVYYDNHANPSATRGRMMSWDSEMGTGSWPGRRYDRTFNFDDPQYTTQGDNHLTGELWCTTMFELYRKLGGDSVYPGVKAGARDLAIRLHLMANPNVPASGATAQQMGQQIEAADGVLGGTPAVVRWRYANGLHKKVIYDTFRRRHLSGYSDKAVDVYINDGREGGYGSASGNDLFAENLWDENYWDTQDIWVKTSPYANAAAQAAGGPADHVEPPVNSTAYLYVRVKNIGTNAGGSGPITVKAFHCLPGMGLVWPTGWTATDTPSLNVTNISPGLSNGVVVGPFPWTPTEVGHECMLVIVECANDKAVTQDLLATDVVPHSDLVPFDNNIAQRNLAPTMAKGQMARGFYINNPFSEPKTITLHFDSSLPQGWQWRTNLPSIEEIPLGPRERHWVEVIIDQAEGQEVTEFERSQGLTVTGTIDDHVIGGMTFYIAPPSAFSRPAEPPVTDITSLADLLNLHIPWGAVSVEGEFEIKVRFRSK